MSTAVQEEVNVTTAEDLGLLPEEFDKIVELLGRTPNFTELSIYSVMWSEHCSYKNSITWLKTLPRTGPNMLVEAGEENAGLVDIGGGLACCFKIESHNHPSALEPYQGAATGVGGINRDIFTMGARPIAQLNSLRFGELDREHTKWLIKGVVKGIGDYGNSFGVPVLGGEVYFDKSYNTNPLVNAMSIGILDSDKMISAISFGVGNPVYIVGSRTGKDGIHGASFASKDITEDSMDDLPSVQVGDPFQEKLLLEASLELADTDTIVGMQDMGAAGITCSTSEMSEKGSHGMNIWLDKVPTRQENMKDWEILLSESQERMLVVVKIGREEEVKAIFDKWDLQCVQIGEVTEGDQLEYFMGGELVASVPASTLVLGGGAPVYEREWKEPAYFAENKKFNIADVPQTEDLKDVAFKLLGNPNIASKRWVYEQYDSMVRTNNMTTNSPSDAGIIELRGTEKAIAVSVDCNGKYVHADPKKGTMIAVSEAARNIVCSGGEPSAITNCLNFGNPYDPEVFWTFKEAIGGMSEACIRFETPVTGGNVSFYNQTVSEDSEEPVFPTPTIGMIGLLEDRRNRMSLDLKFVGDLIFLVGNSQNDLACSEYLRKIHGIENTPAPHFDLEEEYQVQQAIKESIKADLISAAHDVSEGGLFITLAEMGMPRKLGFDIQTIDDIRDDAFLFGEAQSRVVVSVVKDEADAFIDAMNVRSVPFVLLGTVTSGEMIIDEKPFGTIQEAIDTYENVLPNALAH